MIFRESVQRRQLMEFLSGRYDHPAAAEIYRSLKKRIPQLSLGTVYRNLAILEQQGRLQCLMLDPTEMRYDANLTPHAHFICKQCRQVFDIAMPERLDLMLQAQQQAGYRIDRIHLDLLGCCIHCSEKDQIQGGLV